MIFFTYKLTFSNGKIYIGMSKTDVKGLFTNRYRQHEYDAKRGKNSPIYNAWRKHGAPAQEIVNKFSTREECAIDEIKLIEFYNSTNSDFGYNLMKGGEGLNVSKGTAIYEIMRKKVWDNPERNRKLKEKLKGRRPSEATLKAASEFRKSEKGREISRNAWLKDGYRERVSANTKLQMANGGAEYLSKLFKGKPDNRSEEGKKSQHEKLMAYVNSDAGKESCRKGYKVFAENPQNIANNQASLDVWRKSEKNKAQCLEMSKKSKEKCSIKVKELNTGIEYPSQREMAIQLNISDAAISKRVKKGTVVRI